jgi:hypothetical protein
VFSLVKSRNNSSLAIGNKVSAQDLACEDIIFGLVQSLLEVKSSRSKAQLAIKHDFLTAIVNLGA